MRDDWSIWRTAVIVVLATTGGCASPDPDGPDAALLADAAPIDDAPEETEPSRYGVEDRAAAGRPLQSTAGRSTPDGVGRD